LLDWLAAPFGGLLYATGRHYRRYTRRRRQAPQRLRASQLGQPVQIPVLWEDAAGRHPDTIPDWLNGLLTVKVHDHKLTEGSGHPLLFGDFSQFWSRCLDDASTGSLPTLTEPADVLIQPHLPYPNGARALVVVAPEDWQILLTARP
jgi:hypothetical protein